MGRFGMGMDSDDEFDHDMDMDDIHVSEEEMFDMFNAVFGR